MDVPWLGPLQFSHPSPQLRAPEPLNSIAACPQGPLSSAHAITLEMNKYFLGAKSASITLLKKFKIFQEWWREGHVFW